MAAQPGHRRIKDQLKRRQKDANRVERGAITRGGDDTARTATVNQVPDPASINLDALFEAEWRKNILAAALERVRQKFTLKQIQIFDLLVFKEWPAREVARSLGVSLANVYVIRHRVSAAIKKEIKRHGADFEPPGKK